MEASDDYRELRFTLVNEGETERLGQALARLVEPGCVIGLVGPLGSGKTRLVRAMAESLDVHPDAIASPTFVLVHEYEGRLPMIHIDVYRLKSASEFADLGVAEWLGGRSVCVVEWADRVRSHLPETAWWIEFQLLEDEPAARLVRLRLPAEAAMQLRALLGFNVF